VNWKTYTTPVGALLVALAVTGCMTSRRAAQVTPGPAADFTSASQAEVRDAQGQVVLRGTFATVPEDDDDVERKASLSPTGVDPDATGEAEVELSGAGNGRVQEVEFAVRNVQPGAVFTLVIDGKVFATVTANAKGDADHEREVPLPARTP
jgi:hypothetical protein